MNNENLGKKKYVNKEKLVRSLFAALLLVFTFFVFGPLELYLTNVEEFVFRVSDVMIVILYIAPTLFLILFVLGCILPEKVSRIFCGILFGLGIAFYIQGNIMQTNANLLDGRIEDWNRGKWGVLFNVGIWCTCITIPILITLFKNEWAKRYIRYFFLLVIGVQIITLGTLLIMNPSKSHYVYASKEDLFTVSDNKNIIIFVLDAFEVTYMNKILFEHPEYINEFNDFTYYDNTLGLYPTTISSLPYILTGIPYYNEIPLDEYIQQAWNTTNLFSTLVGNDYTTQVYTPINRCLPLKAKQEVSNLRLDSYVDNIKLFKQIYQLTIYKYSPSVMKNFFWTEWMFDVYDEQYVWDDVGFYNELKNNGLKLQSNANNFKLYHLQGAHAPFKYNEEVQNLYQQQSTESAVSQSKGTLKIIFEYISQLKTSNVYDQTMIIIMSDHGSLWLHEYPLLMIKKFNESHLFTVNHAPISYVDIMPSILSEITEQSGDKKTIFDWKESDIRERMFYSYTWDEINNKGWDKNYLPDMTEYVYFNSKYDNLLTFKKGTNKIYTSNGIKYDNKAYEYIFGTRLQFDKNSNDNKYVDGVLSDRWLYGSSFTKSMSMTFDVLSPPDKDLLLVMEFERVYNDCQRMTVFVNDKIVFDDTITQYSPYCYIVIPKDVLDSSIVNLQVGFPDATSPILNDLSYDVRSLSFLIDEFYIDYLDNFFQNYNKYQLGTELMINIDDNINDYMLTSNIIVGEEYAWTLGKRASFMLMLEDKPENDLLFNLGFVGILGDEQRVIFSVNNTMLDEKLIKAGDAHVSFDIPKGIITDKTLSITLDFPDAVSPKSLGIGDDLRVLALALENIVIQEQ